MRGNNGEHVKKLVAANDKKKKKIVEFNHVDMFLCSFYVETATRKVYKLQKPNILSLWVTDLRIPVSTFRNVYVNGADHVTESDLNGEIVTQNGSDGHGVVFARNPPRYRAI